MKTIKKLDTVLVKAGSYNGKIGFVIDVYQNEQGENRCDVQFPFFHDRDECAKGGIISEQRQCGVDEVNIIQSYTHSEADLQSPDEDTPQPENKEDGE